MHYIAAVAALIFIVPGMLLVAAWQHMEVVGWIVLSAVIIHWCLTRGILAGWRDARDGRVNVHMLSPTQYERYCATLLREAGWKVKDTGGQGDQGVDILAEYGGVRAAVQCKRYRGPVGNSAVQEVVAGKAHYGAQIAVVVSPSFYTDSARVLARSNGVYLLHHNALPTLGKLLAE